MQDLIDYRNGIYAFDAGYLRPALAAIHAVVDGGRVAFIDSGTNASLARAEELLAELGLRREAVDYVVLTHVHLDHAGGAGAMMQAFPNAQLVVHPRGVRHMVAPSVLMAGVSAVYGAAEARELYGELIPVPAERLIAAAHGHRIWLGQRELRVLDTPGHARHHICLVDCSTAGIFTGDLFGLSYREFDEDGRPFIFPTTTPTQFDPEAMHRSIELLLSFRPQAAYLTHYAQVQPVAPLAARLRRLIDAHVAIALAARDADHTRQARIRAGLARLLLDELRAFGSRVPDERALDLMATDLDLNAQGLALWLDSCGDRSRAKQPLSVTNMADVVD